MLDVQSAVECDWDSPSEAAHDSACMSVDDSACDLQCVSTWAKPSAQPETDSAYKQVRD